MVNYNFKYLHVLNVVVICCCLNVLETRFKGKISRYNTTLAMETTSKGPQFFRNWWWNRPRPTIAPTTTLSTTSVTRTATATVSTTISPRTQTIILPTATITVPNNVTTETEDPIDVEKQCGIAQQGPTTPNCTSIIQSFSIVGGNRANPTAWPWQVVIIYKNVPICGGSIIDQKFIVTSGRCVADKDPTDLLIKGGSNKIYGQDGSFWSVAHIAVHPIYKRNPLDNDIALLTLTETVSFNATITPICLPEANDSLKVGEGCIVTGWGHTNVYYIQPFNELREVCVPIVSRNVCQSIVGEISQNMFCAGSNGGIQSPCYGDTGGPLVCKRGNIWKLFGIVSGGFQCVQPSIFTRVRHYLDWIHNITMIQTNDILTYA